MAWEMHHGERRNAHPDPRHLDQLRRGQPRLPAHPPQRDKVFRRVTQPRNETQRRLSRAEEPGPSQGCRRSTALGAGVEPKSSPATGRNRWAQPYWHKRGMRSTGHRSPLPATSLRGNTCLLRGGRRIPVGTMQRARRRLEKAELRKASCFPPSEPLLQL